MANLVPRVLSLPPSRKYPGFDWSRVSLKQTAPHQGGLAFLQEAKWKANANLFKLARGQRNGSHQLTFFSKTGTLKKTLQSTIILSCHCFVVKKVRSFFGQSAVWEQYRLLDRNKTNYLQVLTRTVVSVSWRGVFNLILPSRRLFVLCVVAENSAAPWGCQK